MNTRHRTTTVLALAAVAIAMLALPASSAKAQIFPELGILNLTGNNPATGNPWVAGDTYRFAFATEGTTSATSTDIATYNSFVQNAANSSTTFPSLSTVTWRAIGSTASIDARDNTSTNPSTDGTGEAIFLLNGTTRVVNNYADLWDGAVDNRINRTEENGIRANDTPIWTPWAAVWTGTQDNGTANSPLGAGTVRHGLVNAELTFWESRSTSSDNTIQLPMYGLSERLTVLEHSEAQFVASSADNLTLDFGVLGADTGSYDLEYQIENLIGSPAGSRAGLDLTSFDPDSGPFSTGVSTFSNLLDGDSALFSASIDTALLEPGTYTETFQFTLDDTNIPGSPGNLQPLFLTLTAEIIEIAPIPEPATILIAALGILGMGWLGWRRRKRA